MSNHIQRIIIAIVAIPVIIIICMVGGIYFFCFVALISMIALIEFYKLAEAKGAKPLVVLGVIAGFAVNLSFFHFKLHYFIVTMASSFGLSIPFPSQSQLLIIMLLGVVVVLSLVELFRNNGSSILNLSTTLFGIFYISFFVGTFIGLRELFIPIDFPIYRYFPQEAVIPTQALAEKIYRWGGYTTISILAMIWICDTAAYYGGSAFGRHKLFPRVSPNKSWEGAIFGFLFAILSAVAAKYLVLEYLSVWSAVVIGLIVGIFGQFGDFIESLMKRDAGVKDSSALIPGHGGVLDRFDSLLLVSPLVYLYLDFILFS